MRYIGEPSIFFRTTDLPSRSISSLSEGTRSPTTFPEQTRLWSSRSQQKKSRHPKQWLRAKCQWLRVPGAAEREEAAPCKLAEPALPRGIVRLHAFIAELTYKQTASVVINRNHRRQTHTARVPTGHHWPSGQDVPRRKECTRCSWSIFMTRNPRVDPGSPTYASEDTRTAVNIYDEPSVEKTTCDRICLLSARAAFLSSDWFAVRATRWRAGSTRDRIWPRGFGFASFPVVSDAFGTVAKFGHNRQAKFLPGFHTGLACLRLSELGAYYLKGTFKGTSGIGVRWFGTVANWYKSSTISGLLWRSHVKFPIWNLGYTFLKVSWNLIYILLNYHRNLC